MLETWLAAVSSRWYAPLIYLVGSCTIGWFVGKWGANTIYFILRFFWPNTFGPIRANINLPRWMQKRIILFLCVLSKDVRERFDEVRKQGGVLDVDINLWKLTWKFQMHIIKRKRHRT